MIIIFIIIRESMINTSWRYFLIIRNSKEMSNITFCD